ncbi:MAG: Ig-like domain-containing protein [Lachnospiraceae bacterium]|nr:Ig-like domain-containing protein [Lachnospiraceae bacterium]
MKKRIVFIMCCMICMFAIVGMPAMAADEDFVLTEYEKNYFGSSGIEKYNNIDGIWKTEKTYDYTLSYGETITGTISSDVESIKCWNTLGNEYTVNISDNSFSVTISNQQFANKDINVDGTYNVYFEVLMKDGNTESNVLILDYASTNRNVSSGFSQLSSIKAWDAETNEELDQGDIDYLSAQNDIRYIDLTDSENCLKFQLLKSVTKSADILNNMNWISNGENYVIVNGDTANKNRFDATNERYGENYSAPIELKEGYNVVEVYSQNCSCNLNASKKGSSNPKGIALATSSCYSGVTYIIKSNGTKNVEKGHDTSLKMLEATAVIPTNYIEYEIGKDENDYTIELPVEYSTNSKGTFKYSAICFGVAATDPAATCELLDITPIGLSLGNYQFFDTIDLTEIKVKVTAADGETSKVHTIKVNRVAKEGTINSLNIEGGTLDSTFAKDDTSYQVDVEEGSKIKYNLTASVGSTVTLNDKKLTGEGTDGNEYTIEVDPSEYHSIIKVVSGDLAVSNSYYFFYNDDTNEALYEIPESTKELAKSMLTGWNSQTDEQMNETTAGGYWGVFMAKATDVDLKNNIVYDVTHHDMDQATDWAACVMELVMIGENPYDFEGTNYVEGLANCKNDSGSYGPYACNIWTLEAFKTAGYPVEDTLIDQVKRQALTNGADFDMRSWAVAAVAEYLTDEEKAQLLVDYKNAQLTEGKISENEVGMFYSSYYTGANTSTNGDILMALAQLNVNIEKYYAIGDKNPLTVLRDYYMTDDGGFVYDLSGTFAGGYNKDTIIGLGDIVNGSNVWVRYALTGTDMKGLLEKADTMLATVQDETVKGAIETARTAASEAEEGTTNFGPAYYALYDAMAAADPSMKQYGRMCTIAQSESVDAIIEAIDHLGEITLESSEAIADIRAKYDALENDRIKGYVTNYDAFEKAEKDCIALLNNKIAELGDVEDMTLDQKEAVEAAKKAYDALTEDEKKQVTDGETLTTAVNKVAALDVEAVIEALPEELTLDNEEAVNAAQKAYDALTKKQKRLVLADDVLKLQNAQKTIEGLKDQKAADEVVTMINKLGENPTEAQVTAARQAYNALTKAQKFLVDDAVLEVLKKAETTIAAGTTANPDETKRTLTMNNTTLTMAQNETAYLKVTGITEGESISWSSADPSIANVDNSGVVTSYKDGTVVITAETKAGEKVTCKVTVNAKLNAGFKSSVNTVTLSWSKISGSKGYEVYRYDTKTKKYKLIASVSAGKTSYTVKRVNGDSGSKLQQAASYRFQIRSYVTVSGVKVYKKTDTIKTATKPGKAVISKLAKKSSKKVSISWNKQKGSSGYEIWMKSSKNGTYKLVKTITSAKTVKYTKSGLTKNKTYYFKVRAYKTVGDKKVYGTASKGVKIKLN